MSTSFHARDIAKFSEVVRQSSLKRFRSVPSGRENWRITPEAMSFADIAQHLIDADRFLFDKLETPTLHSTQGKARSVEVKNRPEYDALVEELVVTGKSRATLIESISTDQLATHVPDSRAGSGDYGPGPTIPVWWLILRGNIDHEIHHRGALAVYLRVLLENREPPD